MGIFDFLKSKKDNNYEADVVVARPELPAYQDLREAVCPYCKFALSKVPGRKTKCPSCGNFMYVRTSPKNIRAVLTEKEVEKVEEEWSIFNGNHDHYLSEKKRIDDRRAELKTSREGVEPSGYDVRWSLLNEDSISSASRGDWLSYRCFRYQMADLLKKEGKLTQALSLYFEAYYLDLNGAADTSRYPEYMEVKSFSAKDGFSSSEFVLKISKIINKLDLQQEELKEIYDKFVLRFEKNFDTPVSSEVAWKKITKEMKR